MRVTEVFTDLKNRLANAKIGSAEHEQIEEKILAENKKVQEVSNSCCISLLKLATCNNNVCFNRFCQLHLQPDLSVSIWNGLSKHYFCRVCYVNVSPDV